MPSDEAVAAKLFADHAERFGSYENALEAWTNGHINQSAYLLRHPELELEGLVEDVVEEGLDFALTKL